MACTNFSPRINSAAGYIIVHSRPAKSVKFLMSAISKGKMSPKVLKQNMQIQWEISLKWGKWGNEECKIKGEKLIMDWKRKEFSSNLTFSTMIYLHNLASILKFPTRGTRPVRHILQVWFIFILTFACFNYCITAITHGFPFSLFVLM